MHRRTKPVKETKQKTAGKEEAKTGRGADLHSNPSERVEAAGSRPRERRQACSEGPG